ncbi:hypothetical protein [Plantactinospora soyae]|uniref:Uncharacterized protein n=1 Tax=Plantactinospora soyae TaxID=1544732 RepID=A0A927MDR3_9ACTN|nr:hypothetical protein [Plantactinospora soyae]MBE1491231.1 hypothetical protein [Plantactinospora soyae]
MDNPRLRFRRCLDASPDDELAAGRRAELTSAVVRQVRYQCGYLGGGVFALMHR